MNLKHNKQLQKFAQHCTRTTPGKGVFNFSTYFNVKIREFYNEYEHTEQQLWFVKHSKEQN